MKEWFKKQVPPYVRRPLLFLFLCNTAVYNIPKLIFALFGYAWGPFDMTTGFDRDIPVIPFTVWIYFGCYIFWALCYILAARQGKKEMYRFCSAEMLAKLVCFVCFLAIPTTRIRPALSESMTPASGFLMRFLYFVDNPDNLFPSIHIVNSWFCFMGVRKCRELPLWLRAGVLATVLAIAVSILTTAQHVFADILPAIVLAEVCYYISGHTKILPRMAEVLFERIETIYQKCLVFLKLKKKEE